MDISKLKSRASVALLLHLHLNGPSVLSLPDAQKLLGVSSSASWASAREELVRLGLVTAKRQQHGILFTLTTAAPVDPLPSVSPEPEPEPEIDPLDQRAYKIDSMDATGSAREHYSPFARRRLALVGFVGELMKELLPNEKPFTKEQARVLVEAAERNQISGMLPAELLLTVIRRYSVGDVSRTRNGMFAYVRAIVEKEGTAKPQQAPAAPRPQQGPRNWKNEDGLSDAEIDKARAEASAEFVNAHKHRMSGQRSNPFASLLGGD